MSNNNSTELAKELAFGAVAGLCAGYASKKLLLGSTSLVAAAASFIALRAAIFEGHCSAATWSPLAVDDASFAVLRKARRETHSKSKRLEIFFEENLVIVGGFAGGIMLLSSSSG